jgi:glycosyltransferase involved in cell wall biosynthesis
VPREVTTRPLLLVLSSTYPRFANDPEPGFVHELSRRLARDFVVHVLSPHAPGALTHEHLDGVHVHRFRFAPARLETLVQGGGIINNLRHQPWKWLLVPPFMAALVWQTARLIRRLHPDVVHAHWILPQGLALLIASTFVRRLPPFLLTSHGGDLFGLRCKFATWLKRAVLRRADAISVVSRPMAGIAESLGADPQRLTVIPMGVDFQELFTPGPEAARRPGEILFVGRLVEKKGLRYLIEALPRIVGSVAHAHLTIAGYGPEEPALRRLANELGVTGRVTFLGALPQHALPSLYRRATVFVAPFVRAESGDQEGLPVALMEAAACGCPIVAGNLPALDDLFGETNAGQRVLPNDVEALARAVIAVFERPNEFSRRAASLRVWLVERLDWDAVARRYKAFLDSLVSR